MGKHRRPRRHPGQRARRATSPLRSLRSVAATLALASAASGASVTRSAHAEPEPSLAEVEERVDALHRQAEEATERYNAATEEAERARQELDRLQEEAARRTEELNDTREDLGRHASAQYRHGGAGLPPTLQLALAADPAEFLDQATVARRGGEAAATAVAELREQLRAVDQLRQEAGEEADALARARRRAGEERAEVRRRLAEAEELLATRTAEEREHILRDGALPAPRGLPDAAAVAAAAPTERAELAVAFAYAQLGKAYRWGATGPDAYDCSGLTQAAWSAAGVALPRTSQSQATAGTQVTVDALAPGDLVFYYQGLSHVGIYVGDGRIVHASRPGAPISLAPVDSMPIAAATRPA